MIYDYANPVSLQFPIMLAGTIVCSFGTGLLIRIQRTTHLAVWVASMAVAGFGDGMCTNMPYTAIQAILDEYVKASPFHDHC